MFNELCGMISVYVVVRGENVTDIHLFTFSLIQSVYIELHNSFIIVGQFCGHGTRENCFEYTCIYISANIFCFW